ncbi:putative bifunctional diguanylate cyclase/phosphodiesterase [Propylenella binzhouense]|uniref:Bifunctional diguanylate cyclase/phosphodiesterase n=1 Tax=Propylenella binzhouense TaxID=2555902 RepID=A0A964T5Y2_9HYPH|nr:bifunctional diguanylate cyclase/phosphodiesterase [Propylenella binzhouense]MYZ49141.1 bifunctional diguanylate cyclase/phosphodiesterase [Propylenella binzhouense]
MTPKSRSLAIAVLAGIALLLAHRSGNTPLFWLTVAIAAIGAIAVLVRASGKTVVTMMGPKSSDALTGALDRQGFLDVLKAAVARAGAAEGQVGLMLVDLHRFHEINDTWGHGTGDAVLREAAARMGKAAGPGTEVGRISGDEFGVILCGDVNARSLRDAAGRVVDALAEPFQVGEVSIRTGASAGLALYPVNAEDSEFLFRGADLALHRAKQEGRRGIRVFDTELQSEVRRGAALEQELREALRKDEFVVFYQPQMDLASGKIRGYEALVRWERPDAGIVQPMEFIPVAESTGLIHEVGERVLQRACQDAATWLDGGTVAVNLSPAQIRAEGVVERIARILGETGLPPERLEIEVPESVLLGQAPDALANLDALKALGVRIAMDDFGTGYSSLAYLTRFPFDKIKIDRSFVAQLSEDAGVATIIASIIGLGRSLSVDITAEGVETQEQMTMLRAAGCRTVQGFLFGAPSREIKEPVAGSEEPVIQEG